MTGRCSSPNAPSLSPPRDPSAHLRQAQCLDGLRRRPEALRAAAEAERASDGNPRALAAIGLFYSTADEHFLALAAYDRACRESPDNTRLLFSRAVARRAVGQIEGAENDYDRVLELDPKHYESYTNRSNLRTQTPDRNHVAFSSSCSSAVAPTSMEKCSCATRSQRNMRTWRGMPIHGLPWNAAHSCDAGNSNYDITADLETGDRLIEAFLPVLRNRPRGRQPMRRSSSSAFHAPGRRSSSASCRVIRRSRQQANCVTSRLRSPQPYAR